MAYIDPSSSGTLARILVPIFILASAFFISFKQGIQTLIRRLFTKPGK